MPLISENYALIIFAVILIISAVLAWWMGPYANYDKGEFHTFIAILAGLGIFITFLFYYNLVVLQNQQQKLASIQELSRLNDSVLDSVLDSIKASSTIIPNFVVSITPLTTTICCTGGTGCTVIVPEDPFNPETCTQKMVLSYRIFALWQDTILTNGFSDIDSVAYVANYLQRANSQQLYQQWLVTRLDFNSTTQQFGDLLFEYGLPITEQTPEAYITAAEQLIADPRYKDIFKK